MSASMQQKSSPRKQVLAGKLGLWIIVSALILTSSRVNYTIETHSAMGESRGVPSVWLQAGGGKVIEFQTQNGRTISEITPEVKKIPHLVLFRNGDLSGVQDRTLKITLAMSEVPATGKIIHLKVQTQHGNSDRGGNEEHRIPVWEFSQCLPQYNSRSKEDFHFTFEKVFTEMTHLGNEQVLTPSDYFRIEIAVFEDNSGNDKSESQPVFTYVEEFAFLMENHWVEPLRGLEEITPGAAPDELAIFYCDLFPFQKNPYDPGNRLPRTEVNNYIEELAPALAEAVRVQTNEWGFPWHEEWTGFQDGSTGERIEIALSTGYIWYHGKTPTQAHGNISINLDYKNRNAYDSLTDWIVSVFHHELFHNVQRNKNIAHGREGELEGSQQAWEVLTEGTAVLAASVGNQEVEFDRSHSDRSYVSRSNRFLVGTEFFDSGLETSYEEIDPYSAAFYWRFLYEQCGRTNGVTGDRNAGMQVIRQALDSLYISDEFHGISREELVETLPVLMNEVFSKAIQCPFRSYEESLIHFSLAIYSLRLEGGRCQVLSAKTGCGFYDPYGMYSVPEVEEIAYNGNKWTYASGIATSFGIQFVEILLDPMVDGESFSLEFEPSEAGTAVFSVQVLNQKYAGEGQLAISTSPDLTGMPASDLLIGGISYEIDQIELEKFNRIGLVITRLDSREELDSAGAFTITLEPID